MPQNYRFVSWQPGETVELNTAKWSSALQLAENVEIFERNDAPASQADGDWMSTQVPPAARVAN